MLQVDEFQLHAHLNPDHALQYAPCEINMEGLPPLASNWFDDFIAFWSERIEQEGDKQKFITQMHAKAGQRSTYTYKEELLNSLSIIHRRSQGQFDKEIGVFSEDEMHATLVKLQQGIEHCSDGYFDRVQEIVMGYQRPKTFTEFLTRIRTNLVEKIANELSDEVHSHTQVFNQASVLGLGIMVKHHRDPYAPLHNRAINIVLQRFFNEAYYPLNLPYLFCEVLRPILALYGYTGAREANNPYGSHAWEKIQNYIHRVFFTVLKPQSYFGSFVNQTSHLFIVNEDGQPIDLNWKYIEKLIFEALLQLNVIQEEALEIKNLTRIKECAQLSAIFMLEPSLIGAEEDIINQQSIISLRDELVFLQNHYKDYFDLLLEQLGKQLPSKVKTWLWFRCLDKQEINIADSLFDDALTDFDFAFILEQEETALRVLKDLKSKEPQFYETFFQRKFEACRLSSKYQNKIYITLLHNDLELIATKLSFDAELCSNHDLLELISKSQCKNKDAIALELMDKLLKRTFGSLNQRSDLSEDAELEATLFKSLSSNLESPTKQLLFKKLLIHMNRPGYFLWVIQYGLIAKHDFHNMLRSNLELLSHEIKKPYVEVETTKTLVNFVVTQFYVSPLKHSTKTMGLLSIMCLADAIFMNFNFDVKSINESMAAMAFISPLLATLINCMGLSVVIYNPSWEPLVDSLSDMVLDLLIAIVAHSLALMMIGFALQFTSPPLTALIIGICVGVCMNLGAAIDCAESEQRVLNAFLQNTKEYLRSIEPPTEETPLLGKNRFRLFARDEAPEIMDSDPEAGRTPAASGVI